MLKTETGLASLVQKIMFTSKQTGVLKATWSALTGAISAHPFVAVGVAVATLVGGFIALQDALTTTVDEVKDAYDESYNAKSDLEDVNNELAETKERMAELNAMENLSLVDAEELENLKKVNKQLELEQKLKAKIAAQKAEEANETAMKFFNAKGQYDVVSKNGDEPITYGSYIDSVNSKLDRIAQIDIDLEKYAADSDEYKALSETREEFVNQVNTSLEEFMEADDGLLDKETLARLEEIYTKANVVFGDIATTYTDTIEGVFKKEQFDGLKEKLTALAKVGLLTGETLTTRFSDFTNVLLEAGVPLEAIVEYMKYLADPDALNYEEVKKQFGKDLGFVGSGGERSRERFAAAGLNIDDKNVLDAYIALRDDGGTETWNVGDWIKNIQEKLNQAEIKTSVEILGVSETVEQLNSDLKPAMDSLASAWKEIFADDMLKLDDIDLLSISTSIKSELDALAESGKDIGEAKKSYEEFVRILENSESTEADVKQGFNNLADSIVDAATTGIEDFETLKDVLEDLGVVNSDIIAFEALATNTEALTASGLDLKNATEQQIIAFARERVEAENCAQAIAILQFEQMRYNMTELTNENVDKLVDYAKAAGVTGTALADLVELQILLKKVNSDDLIDTQELNAAYQRIEEIKQNWYKGYYKDLEYATPDVTTLFDKDKEEVDFKNLLDKELDILEKAADAGTITYKQSLEERKQLVEKYYNHGKISAAEYYKYLEDLAKAKVDYYEKVLDAVNSRIDREIDGIQDLIDALEKQNDALEKQLGIYDSALTAVQDLIEAEKEKHQDNIDQIEKENDAIQDQIDQYDKMLGAVTLVFNEKREALQAEQDAIDDRIAALQDENDEYQKSIELEKAKAALEKARNQRTKYLYSGKERGFIYQTDYESITDAEKTVSDLNFNATIDALEKEKELIQDVIDKLDETEQKWQEISSAFDDNKAKSAAEELFGTDYENIILNGDPELIASVMNNYTSAQQKLEDNASLIESINDKIANLDKLSEKWNEVADAHEKAANREKAALILGQDWQNIVLNDRQVNYDIFKNNYLAIQAQIEDNTLMIESYNEKIEYYEKLKEQWEKVTEAHAIAQETRLLNEEFGKNAEADILTGRLDTINSFKEQYLAAQEEMALKAEESARRQITAAEEAARAQEFIKNIATDYDNSNLSDEINRDNSNLSDEINKDTSNLLLLQKQTTKEGIESDLNNYSDDFTRQPGSNKTPQEEIKEYVDNQFPSADDIWPDGKPTTVDDFQKSISDSLFGNTIKVSIEEDHSERSNISKKNVTASLFSSGGVISDKDESNLDWMAEQLGEDHMVAVKNDERILTPAQNETYEKLRNAAASIVAGFTPALQVKNPSLAKAGSTVMQTVTQHITITLPNVTNENGYDKLVKTLQSLPLTAYQKSFKQ